MSLCKTMPVKKVPTRLTPLRPTVRCWTRPCQLLSNGKRIHMSGVERDTERSVARTQQHPWRLVSNAVHSWPLGGRTTTRLLSAPGHSAAPSPSSHRSPRQRRREGTSQRKRLTGHVTWRAAFTRINRAIVSGQDNSTEALNARHDFHLIPGAPEGAQ